MHRWRQWWTRSVRAGHAFAEGAALHGQPPERHFAAETRRAVLWGGVLPLAALLVLPVSWMATLLLLLAYPLQFLRVGLRLRQQGRPCPWWQSLFFLQGRFAEARGVLKFRWGVISRRRSALIEYK